MDGKIDWTEQSQATVSSARVLYEAYLHNSGGLTWNGLPCPTWEQLNDPVRSHWCAVVLKARDLSAVSGL